MNVELKSARTQLQQKKRGHNIHLPMNTCGRGFLRPASCILRCITHVPINY